MNPASRRSAVGIVLALELLESRRLLSGGLDPTFGVGGIATPQADSGAVTTDTLVLDSGTAFVVLGHTEATNPLYLFRYEPLTGQTQTTNVTDPRLANLKGLDPTNVPARNQRFLARQSTGKIILAGRTDSSYVVARFNPDSSLDTTFGAGGVRTIDRPRAATTDAILLNVGVSSDDKIVLIAFQTVRDSSDSLANLVAIRFTAAGAVDTSYGSGGVAMTPDSTKTFDLRPTRAALAADGKIVTAGDTDSGHPIFQFVARYNADLSTDDGFGEVGVASVPRVQDSSQLMALALAPDGKIFVAGRAELSRYNADGSPDLSFDSDGLVELASAVPPLSGVGQILPKVGGKVTLLLDTAEIGGAYNAPLRLVRFNANGSLDSSFGAGGQSSLAPVTGVDFNLSAVELGDGRVALTNGESVALAGPRPDFELAANGTLLITGTSSADTISITVVGSTLHAVRNEVEQTWPLADVDRIDIEAEGGNDIITIAAPLRGVIHAQGGNDSITLTGSPAASVYAGDGNDTIFGSTADDFIDGGAGNDSIDAGTGNDSVTDNAGEDTVLLGDGNDMFECADTGSTARFVDGGAGDDTVRESAGGASTILGGAGNDRIFCGGSTPKSIDAGDGNDLVSAAFPSGTITAGDGDDLISASATGSVNISGGGGNDSIRVNTVASTRATISGDDGIDTIRTSDGDDLIVGGANKDFVYAGGGNDTVRGYGGHDRIFGQGGDDLLCGAAGNDRLDGGDGDDSVSASEGEDFINGGANKDIVHAGNGNDTVRGYGGNDQIFGQGGDDLLYGIAGNDRLDGGDGNDSLLGNAGSNRLSGGGGDDFFWAANSAADFLDGGEGSNRGAFDDLLDTVTGVLPV